MRALVYGAMNPDLVHVVDRLPQAGDDVRSHDTHLMWGGKAANAAMALSTWGVDTRLLGLVVGEDPLGDVLFEALAHRRLGTSWIERSPGDRTRHCVVLLTPDGDRTIVCAGYDGARWQDVPEAAWDGIDVALVDGFGGDAAITVVAGALDRGIPVVWLDAPSPPPRNVDMVVWSRHERAEGEAAWLGVRGHNLALTGGAAPVLVFWAGERIEVAPPPVVTADSTGAGDVFAAACAFGIASGWSPRRLLVWAAAAGAASARGGRAALPGRRSIDALATRAVGPGGRPGR